MLNAGLGFSDEFELEVCNYSDKSSSKLQQYRDWVHTMRREGTAFFKTVKNRVRFLVLNYNEYLIMLLYHSQMYFNFQANPAMKSAVKTVRISNEKRKLKLHDYDA